MNNPSIGFVAASAFTAPVPAPDAFFQPSPPPSALVVPTPSNAIHAFAPPMLFV